MRTLIFASSMSKLTDWRGRVGDNQTKPVRQFGIPTCVYNEQQGCPKLRYQYEILIAFLWVLRMVPTYFGKNNTLMKYAINFMVEKLEELMIQLSLCNDRKMNWFAPKAQSIQFSVRVTYIKFQVFRCHRSRVIVITRIHFRTELQTNGQTELHQKFRVSSLA